jgi:hypothetical protein
MFVVKNIGFKVCIKSRSCFLSSLSPIDTEKEMFKIKRRMAAFYNRGSYLLALECAEELEITVADTFGKKNTVYASCLNNIALMVCLSNL